MMRPCPEPSHADLGLGVTMPAEVGLLSASDEADLEFTRKEGRLLVTAGDDFLALAAEMSGLQASLLVEKEAFWPAHSGTR